MCEQLDKKLMEVKSSNPVKLHGVIEFDWVRLPNTRLTTPGSYPENAVSSYLVNWPKNVFHHDDRMRCILNFTSNPEEYSSNIPILSIIKVQCIYILQRIPIKHTHLLQCQGSVHLYIVKHSQQWWVVQYTRSVTGRQTGVDPWRIVTARPYVSVWDMWADRHGGVVSWPFVSSRWI